MTKSKTIKVSLAINYQLILDAISELISRQDDIEVLNKSSNLVDLMESISSVKSDMLIIDVNIPKLDISKINKINYENKNNPNILLLVDNEVEEIKLVSFVKNGIKGYFYKENEFDQLLKCIRVINDGELWVERKLLPKIIDDNELAESYDDESPVYKLTQAELRIFKLVLNGYTNKQIAEEVYISEKTVKFHLYKVFRKLSVKSRSELIIFGFKNGFA